MKMVAIVLSALLLSACSYRTRTWMMPQPDGYVYVPTGVIMDYQGKNEEYRGRNITVMAFWMAETEVTNKQYHEYLADVAAETPPVEAIYNVPDSIALQNDLWISKYIDYFTNPAFDDFPVVGLTKSQMIDYAKWLSKKTSETNGLWTYEFRLPTVFEWRFAAYGGRSSANTYPWGGPYDRNSKGCYLLHCYTPSQFKVIGENESSGSGFYTRQDLSQKLVDSMYNTILVSTKNWKKTKRKYVGRTLPLIGMPVFADAYFPNDYGLYGMSGNVAEMTHEGEVIGGSFRTTSAYCKIMNAEEYPFDASQPQCDVGFRLVCSYVSARVEKKE